MFRRKDQSFIQRQNYFIPTTFITQVCSGVIYEYPPHKLSRNSEEMGASLPACCLLANELKVCLMNESSGLEGVVLPLTSHVTSGKPLQFVVDQRNQLLGCLLVAVRKLTEQDRNVGLLRIHRALSVGFALGQVADILPHIRLLNHEESEANKSPPSCFCLR